MIPAAAAGNHDTAKLVSYCISGKNVAVLGGEEGLIIFGLDAVLRVLLLQVE